MASPGLSTLILKAEGRWFDPPPLTTSCEQVKRPGGSLRPGHLTATVTATVRFVAFGYASASPSLPSALRFSSSDVWA